MKKLYASTILSLILFFLLLQALKLMAADEPKVHTSHGMTLFGELKYGPDFEHFDYVNPDAPKGGTCTHILLGTFDSLNMYIIFGTAPYIPIYESLMARSFDEPVSIYGLLAESITFPDDYSWVEFKLRDIARFHDGKPVTVEDVIFTFETLKAHGRPQYRDHYNKVSKVEKTGPLSVRFTFKEKGDRSNAYGLASMMPVFPKHYWKDRDFTKTTFDIPLSSGPYRINKVDPGRSIVIERVKDYWGKDLAINRGRHNFDVRQYDFYRDLSISQEAFIAGKADVKTEMDASVWVNSYDAPPVHNGYIKKELVEMKGTKMYRGIYFNLRKEKFKDPKVREALAYAFDWEWTSKTLYHGLNKRLRSYFQNSELEARGLPGLEELKILEPYRAQLDPRIFTEEYSPPKTDATQASLRKNLAVASKLLKEAGYTIKDGRLLSKKGTLLSFEIPLAAQGVIRLYAPFIANLRLLGIDARMRMIDNTELMQRIRSLNYDILIWFNMPQSQAPGQELRNYYGSESADQQAGSNYMGIKSPIVDDIIEKIIFAPDRKAKVAAVKALDRVLCWSFYSIPLYYEPDTMLAYWDRFGRPRVQHKWFSDFATLSTWWIDKEKDKIIKEVRGK